MRIKILSSALDDLHEGRLKIRHCFFKADKSKVVNCVPTSDAAQHIETSIKRQK